LHFTEAGIAADSPHSSYTNTPDECSRCHLTHTAQEENLAAESIINELCLSCHDGTGSTKIVSPHSNDTIEDEDTFTIACTECHTPHEGGANLNLIRNDIRDNEVTFLSVIGPDSFDEDIKDAFGHIDDSNLDDVCATCHTNTSHNNNFVEGDPGYQLHHEGEDCVDCHSHDYDGIFSTNDGFMPL